MEILVITREFPPYQIGGLCYHLKYLYEELAERKHDISVLSARPASLSPRELEAPSGVCVNWVDVPTETGYQILAPFYLYNRLRKVELDDFDVVMTHTETLYDFDIPTVSKFHDHAQVQRQYFRQELPPVPMLADSVLNPIRKRVSQRELDNADHLIFNSELTEQSWRTSHSVSSPTSVIYNGVNTEVFEPRTGIDGEFYLFVGHNLRKGIDTIRNFAVQADHPVYVVGEGVEPSKNIKPIGRVEQERLVDYYSGAIATLHPAGFEAFGNVILESLACGTPVVVSESCGAAEIIEEPCGVVTDDLEDGIKRVRGASESQCVKLANNHIWQNVADHTEEVAETATY